MADRNASELGTYAALLRRRRALILTIMPAVILIAVFLAYALPPKYRSTATILLVQGSISDKLILSTVNSSADEEIETIQGRVMTQEALESLVKDYDPYPDQPTWDLQKKAEQIITDSESERVDPVTFEVLQKSPAFSLHYENPDPRRAAIVTQKLSDLFLTYHQRERVEAAKAAARMVQNRANDLAQELQKLDEEYAVLKAQHGGILPDASDHSDEARYRAERDLNDLEKQLRSAEEEESLLTIQLSSTSPNLLATQGLTAGSSIPGQNPALASAQAGMTDLATVKALLADAELRYTPDHPDVKRLKRALAALQAQQKEAGANGIADADNPEYRRITSQLAAARSEVKAMQAATARARDQLAHYQSNASPTAALSQQVADLDRRRASLQAEFTEVQEKLKGAMLGQQVEADVHAEHFTLLRAPVISKTPYSPNRLGVILLGFVLGGAIAAAVVAAAESSDATVRGMQDVSSFGSIPVVGTISEILTPADIRRRRLIWGAVVIVYVAATAFVVLAVVQAQIRDFHVQESSST